MKKVFIALAALAALVLVAFPVFAEESIADRIARLEANNQAIADDLASIKADVAQLKASNETLVAKIEGRVTRTGKSAPAKMWPLPNPPVESVQTLTIQASPFTSGGYANGQCGASSAPRRAVFRRR